MLEVQIKDEGDEEDQMIVLQDNEQICEKRNKHKEQIPISIQLLHSIPVKYQNVVALGK